MTPAAQELHDRLGGLPEVSHNAVGDRMSQAIAGRDGLGRPPGGRRVDEREKAGLALQAAEKKTNHLGYSH